MTNENRTKELKEALKTGKGQKFMGDLFGSAKLEDELETKTNEEIGEMLHGVLQDMDPFSSEATIIEVAMERLGYKSDRDQGDTE